MKPPMLKLCEDETRMADLLGSVETPRWTVLHNGYANQIRTAKSSGTKSIFVSAVRSRFYFFQ